MTASTPVPFVLGHFYPATLLGTDGQALSTGVARFCDDNSGVYRADYGKLDQSELTNQVSLLIGSTVIQTESWHRCLDPHSSHHFHFGLLDKPPVVKPEDL